MSANMDKANQFLEKAAGEMERMRTFATMRAAVFTGMAFVIVMGDVKIALDKIAKEHKNIADEMDRANRNRR